MMMGNDMDREFEGWWHSGEKEGQEFELSDEGLKQYSLTIWQAGRTPLLARIAELEAQLSEVKASFRVNMLRAFPKMSHDEITAEIDRVIGKEARQSRSNDGLGI